MRKWFTKSAAAPPAAAQPEVEEAPAPPPPPPLRLGVPLHACSLAVDPVQGTVAVGSAHGDVQLFGRNG